MFRLIVVVFFLSLIIGTYVTGNLVANWIACLAALALLVRARRRGGERPSAAVHADQQSSPPSPMPRVSEPRSPIPAPRTNASVQTQAVGRRWR
jgi:hypothetical protein